LFEIYKNSDFLKISNMFESLKLELELEFLKWEKFEF